MQFARHLYCIIYAIVLKENDTFPYRNLDLKQAGYEMFVLCKSDLCNHMRCYSLFRWFPKYRMDYWLRHGLPPWRKGRITCLWIKSVFDCLTIGIIYVTMVVQMTWVWTFFNNHIYVYIYIYIKITVNGNEGLYFTIYFSRVIQAPSDS